MEACSKGGVILGGSKFVLVGPFTSFFPICHFLTLQIQAEGYFQKQCFIFYGFMNTFLFIPISSSNEYEGRHKGQSVPQMLSSGQILFSSI